MSVFPTQALSAGVSGSEQIESAGVSGLFQFLRNFRSQNAFEQTALILQAALDPSVASKARKGEFVRWLDHFDLLQTARN
jgi:hypothetical protein